MHVTSTAAAQLFHVASRGLIPCHIPPCRTHAVAALLEQRDAITNWAQFRAANNISGWAPEAAADVCRWTGIRCNGAGEVSVL